MNQPKQTLQFKQSSESIVYKNSSSPNIFMSDHGGNVLNSIYRIQNCMRLQIFFNLSRSVKGIENMNHFELVDVYMKCFRSNNFLRSIVHARLSLTYTQIDIIATKYPKLSRKNEVRSDNFSQSNHFVHELKLFCH